MKTTALTPMLCVSGQIQPEDVATLYRAGIRRLINNRPDGEAEDQPSSAAIAEQASALGMEYYHLPVTANNFPGEDEAKIRELFAQQNLPTAAFCRTGTRCTNLWVISQESQRDRDAALEKASEVKADLAMATKYLSAR